MTEEDEICAKFLRHCGLTNRDIGQVLNRSEYEVTAKLCNAGTDESFYECARPILAKQWGEIADNMPVMGTA